MELDFNTIAIIIGVIAAIGGGIYHYGKLVEKVKQLEKKLESSEQTKIDKANDNPKDILKRKLANQEISPEKYDELLKKLDE